jgi:fused signal recognition particle receptor
MELIYVLLALAIVAGAYFLFFRKKQEPALPPGEPQVSTRPKAERPAPSAESAKPAARGPSVEKAAPAPQQPREPEAEAEVRPSVRPPPPSRREPQSVPPKAAEKPAPAKSRDVSGLRRGLAKSREAEGFFGRLRALFAGKKELSPELAAQIEEVLLTSDVGV